MSQNMLSSRAVLVSLVSCVLIVGGSLFYNWHIRRTAASIDLSDAFLPSTITSSQEETSGVLVSPHGFGLYPEIPTGATIAAFDEADSVEMELLLRVAVKKWNEGERFEGASITNGRVYLHYPNTLYVKQGVPLELPDGTVYHPIRQYRGAGDVDLTQEQVLHGEIPPGVNVVEMDAAGFDPYEVLDLPR